MNLAKGEKAKQISKEGKSATCTACPLDKQNRTDAEAARPTETCSIKGAGNGEKEKGSNLKVPQGARLGGEKVAEGTAEEKGKVWGRESPVSRRLRSH